MNFIMKKLVTSASLAFFTLALTLISCDDTKNEYPDKYVGFAKSTHDFTYRKEDASAEFQVKIIAVDKSKEDRPVYIDSPQRPQNGGNNFFRIKENKITIKAGKKSAKATIILYPQKIGINNYVQLTCRTEDKKAEVSKTTIRLLKK